LPGRFTNKVVLVTGAARGQGRADALAFAKEGADLILNDICHNVETIPYAQASKKDLAGVVREVKSMGRKAMAVEADVRDGGEVKALVDDAVEQFGKIDVLYCNAGVWNKKYPQDITEDEWDVMMDVNLKGAFLCSKYVAPHMIKRKYGRIVMNSSIEGLIATPAQAHYIASKFGMIGLVKALAVDLGKYNITANAVCPAGVVSGMGQYVSDFYAAHPEYQKETKAVVGSWTLIPSRQILQPEDVSGAVLFLASDDAKYITGVALPVDTGYTAK
jgi:SDR family mycofactocin-dependent oxidoreductase